jgi:pilus assembly protein CpaE
MPQTIPIVIIDSDTDSINNISQYIKNLGSDVSVEGVATSFDTGFELIHKKRPLIVIIEVGDDIDLSIQRITQILNRFPQVSVLATSADRSSETILKVMRAGATEYLLRPVADTDLGFALQKLGRLWLTKPATAIDAGRIFTVFSPKGGVGVTTIAINLAVDIYEMTKKPTIIVDLDLSAGDVTTFLNMKPNYTITDVTANISRLDKSFLQRVIATHESGIFVLAEPQRVEEGVSISAAEISKLLGLLKTMFSYIIIDAENVSERTTTAMKMSDILLTIFIMSLPNIKNIKRHLRYFEKIGLGRDKTKIVVNRYLKKGEISMEDAVNALKYPISWTIPNDFKNAMLCLNKGIPFSAGAPKSMLNTSVKEMADALINGKI